jgi:hypothetical protein
MWEDQLSVGGDRSPPNIGKNAFSLEPDVDDPRADRRLG